MPKFKNSNAIFGVIFKQCEAVSLPLFVFREETSFVNLSNLIFDPPACFLKPSKDSLASFLVIPVTSCTTLKSLLDGPQPIFKSCWSSQKICKNKSLSWAALCIQLSNIKCKGTSRIVSQQCCPTSPPPIYTLAHLTCSTRQHICAPKSFHN